MYSLASNLATDVIRKNYYFQTIFNGVLLVKWFIFDMRVFVLFNGERHCLDVQSGQTVGEMKQMLRRKFDLDTVQNEDKENDLVMIIRFAGGSLLDDWIYSDLNIASGVTLKCELVENVKSYLNVYCVYSGETLKFTEMFPVFDTKVSDLRSMIMDKTGLHVSVFRLVTQHDEVEMFDCHYLKDYNINIGDTLRLETWDGWANFLKAATRGHLTPTLKYMVSLNEDPLVAKYQLRVALFIAAHYGYHQLAALLLKSGARSDEPVGEHPIREWCNRDIHFDHLKTPVHQAAQNGSLVCLRQFVHHNYACILVKDGNGLTPCNIARRFKQTECFKLLIAEQFRSRSMDGLTITLYAKIKKWSERAKDRALVFHKHNPSPLLLAMEKRTYRKAAVGQKVYVDGYGKRLQTSASKIEFSLVQSDARKKSSQTGESEINSKAYKPITGSQLNTESRNENLLFLKEKSAFEDFEGPSESSDERNAQNRSKTQLTSRNSTESLPAVSESRCHGAISKQETMENNQLHIINLKQKNKQKRIKHNSYRWKDSTENDEKSTEKNPSPTEHRLSIKTPVLNGSASHIHNNNNENYNPRLPEPDQPRKDAVDVERVFVTETLLDIKDKPTIKTTNSWIPDREEGSRNESQTPRMPPIHPIRAVQSPESLNIQHNYKKLISRDNSDKRRSEDNVVRKSEGLKRGSVRKRTMSEDPALHSTALYRHVTGLGIRESARASLEVATTFNKMSWLQQVQLAIDLNKNTFKRSIFPSKTAK